MPELTQTEKRVRQELRMELSGMMDGTPLKREDMVASFDGEAAQRAAHKYIDSLINEGILDEQGQNLVEGQNIHTLL